MKSVYAALVAATLVLVGPVSSAVADDIRLPRATSGADGSSALASTDYSSIFAQALELADSGWSRCEPITWSADTRRLNASQSKRQLTNLRWALGMWSRASGLNFAFAGTTALTFDEDAFSLTPVDGSPLRDRHVSFAFISAKGTALLAGRTVALGSPSSVATDSKEIIAGTAVFETAYVNKATARQSRNLYLHEIGHVLGLAHAHSATNVMYPIITDHVRLGPGDVNGIQALTKACQSGTS